MDKFNKHTGIIAPLDNANVDTDQIIAKQFLKSIKRTGFGEQLFYDWRYKDDGTPNSEFEMNEPRYKGASVLVTRNNFGCGSSREHAVWAVAQYGLKAIIAPRKGDIPGFADIFKNNCVKNGVVTVELTEEEVQKIFDIVRANEGLEVTVDLENQKLTLHAPEEIAFSFEVNPASKNRLINGLDDIGLTLTKETLITEFEKTHNPQLN